MPPDLTPEFTFQVIPMHCKNGDACCLTNDAESAATFMWGRSVSNYGLFVNGRRYEMCTVDLESHIKYCLEMDTAFYGDK